MQNILLVLQVVTGIFLTIFILLQAKGTGFGRSTVSSSSFTRRGLEKLLFSLTFVFAALFVIISIVQLIT